MTDTQATVVNADSLVEMTHLEEDSRDLVFADPPFGIDFGKNMKMYNRDAGHVVGGYCEVQDYEDFTSQWVASAHRILRPGGTLWAVSGWTNAHIIHAEILRKGFILINKIIWRYNFGVYTTKKFTTCHYEMFYAVKPPKKKRTFNRLSTNTKADYHDRQSVWDIKRQYAPGRKKNATKLPDLLVEKVIRHTTNAGDLIVDPFLGNGTTVFAARILKRAVLGYEINPEAYEAVVERLRGGI
jgi:site-specific DNA-methyltransferase (adenine-specific)